MEECREYLDKKDFVLGTILTDLSKAFGCIPHDLLTSKLGSCGLGEETYSYFTNRNQCVEEAI